MGYFEKASISTHELLLMERQTGSYLLVSEVLSALTFDRENLISPWSWPRGTSMQKQNVFLPHVSKLVKKKQGKENSRKTQDIFGQPPLAELRTKTGPGQNKTSITICILILFLLSCDTSSQISLYPIW